MLLNADWGFFAPLHLCVIFALKKISLAEVFGYAPIKILNKTLASRLCSRRFARQKYFLGACLPNKNLFKNQNLTHLK
jgi:hypothetical protein